MKKIAVGVFLSVLLLNDAVAVPITINADSFALNSNVSTANSGLTLRSMHRSVDAVTEYRDVFITSAPQVDSVDGQPVVGFGEHVFAWQKDNGNLNGVTFATHYPELYYDEYNLRSEYATFRVDFFEPVQYLSAQIYAMSDPGVIMAYDSSGNLLGRYFQSFGGPYWPRYNINVIEVTRNQADIAYVLIGGSSGGGRLNEFTYDVPAPAPIALLSMGLLGGAFLRKKKGK